MELVEPLVKSMIDLSDANTVVYVSYEEHNDQSVNFFWETAEKFFTIERVPKDDLDPVYRSDFIHVLKLRKK